MLVVRCQNLSLQCCQKQSNPNECVKSRLQLLCLKFRVSFQLLNQNYKLGLDNKCIPNLSESKSEFFSSMIWLSVLEIGCGLLFICFKISKCQERDSNKRVDGERRPMTKKHTPSDHAMRVTAHR